MLRREFLQILMATPIGAFFFGKKETSENNEDDIKMGEEVIIENFLIKPDEKRNHKYEKRKGRVQGIERTEQYERDNTIRTCVVYRVLANGPRGYVSRYLRRDLIKIG